MKPRIGVDDLEKSRAFYRALGLQSEGIVGTQFEHGAVAFFQLEPGLKLALWPRASIVTRDCYLLRRVHRSSRLHTM